MTRIGDISAVLEDIDEALKRHLEPTTSSEVDTEAIESILGGQPYFIGLKDRSEDLIPSVMLWVEGHRQDEAVKVS
jgi:hypothetical protein